MSKANDKRRREANVAAGITVVFVALFATAFIGVITMLNNMADQIDVEEEVTVGAEAPADPFYVLLIGSDSRKGTALYTGKSQEHAQVDQHSDIMTLMRVDPATYKITLVTVPRDTVIDGQTQKINDALLDNDPAKVVDAVAELTGVRADYYLMTNFIAFENLVNAIGGIDITVPQTVTVPDPATGKNVTVKAGKNRHLDGRETLVVARARKEYADDQDALRQVNVRTIERALIEKVLAMDGSFDAEHVLTALESGTKTDLDLPSMGLLMFEFVEHADEVVIYECTGPYKGDNRSGDNAWVIPEDEKTWSALMAAVDAGEDPSGIVKPPSF